MNAPHPTDRDRVFAGLVRDHQGLLFSVVFGITLDREETFDVLQETFLRAAGEPHFSDDGFQQRAWLVRVARNLALNTRRGLWRAMQRLSRWLAGEPTRSWGDPADGLIREESLAALRDALATLTPEERDLLGLRYAVGLSTAAIAAELGVEPGTVKSRLARLRERLGKTLIDREEDEP